MKTATPGATRRPMLTLWLVSASIVLVCHPNGAFAQNLPTQGTYTVAPIPDISGTNSGSGITLASCPGCSSLPPSGGGYGPGILGYGKFGE
ncbi:MAG TPA: hypothetical protein VG097_19330, partial [Gemmata sp.]|nr:hypothetical protein [Gemmata sp.]